MFSLNGAPRGQNVTSDQSSYDLIFKDIIINYPPPISNVSGTYPSKYTISLNFEFDRLYKAELIVANVHFNTIIATSSLPDSYNAIPNSVKNSTIIVSIPQLDNITASIANQQSTTTNGTINNNSNYTNNVFCQIPDNYTPLGGANNLVNTSVAPANSISTFIGGPPFSAEQFYNPPLNNISQLDIYLLDIYGNNLLSPQPCTQNRSGTNYNTTSFVNSFYFTIRLYYFVKRNNTTQFSVPLFNYAASGSIDSIFENKRYN